MKCSRCGMEISDTETICPYCFENVNDNLEFNNYRKDGFVALKEKQPTNEKQPKHNTPKYFNVTELNIFVIAVVFVLIVSVLTVFGLQFLKYMAGPEPVETIYVSEYIPTKPPETTAPVIKNEVKSFSIKDLYGSWKNENDKESQNTAIPYYTFDKDGTVTVYHGSMTYDGTFEDLSEGKKHRVNIRVKSTDITGTYNFKITGNKKDGYTLELSSITSEETIKLVNTTAKTYNLDTIPNFKMDNRICGNWVTKDGERTYTFRNNGRMKRITENVSLNGVWTIYEDGKITIKYMKTNVETIELNYRIIKEQLVINDSVYYKQ